MTLTKRQPYCYSTVLGSHNSAISLADGYGNLDPYFQQYFKWIKWVVRTSLPSCLLPFFFMAAACAGLAFPFVNRAGANAENKLQAGNSLFPLPLHAADVPADLQSCMALSLACGNIRDHSLSAVLLAVTWA